MGNGHRVQGNNVHMYGPQAHPFFISGGSHDLYDNSLEGVSASSQFGRFSSEAVNRSSRGFEDQDDDGYYGDYGYFSHPREFGFSRRGFGQRRRYSNYY